MKWKIVHISELDDFKIDSTVDFKVTKNSEGTFLDNDELNLHSSGANLRDAKRGLLSEINFVWAYFVHGEHDKLDDDSVAYAKRLSQHISGPAPEPIDRTIKCIIGDGVKYIHFDELGGYKIDPSVFFVLSFYDEAIFLDNELLDLYASGESFDEVKNDLLSEIEFVWDFYVNGDPSKMGEDAKNYAKIFARHITKIS